MTDQTKKTDAWMPLWIGDYLADTMSLNTAQHGAYLLLLVAYWRNKGPLPDDDEDLATTVRATPAEWKKLRVKMLKFFDLEGGLWIHSRANKELERAGLFAKKAHDRAVKAAAARWGAKAQPQEVQEACSEHASSIPQEVPEQCPTPSPSQGIGIPPDVAKEINQGAQTSARVVENPEPTMPTPYGLAGRAMKSAGLSDVNPGHPKLRALVDEGITVDELSSAARDAAAKGKGFSYALAVAEGRRRDAAGVRTLPAAAMPPGPPESAHARKMREAAEGLAPGVAKRRPGTAPIPVTIDLETPHVPAIASH